MKLRAIILLGVVFLSGCETPQQKAAKFEENFERDVETYGASCEKFGFKRDTDMWRHCVMTASPYGLSHH